MINNLSLRTGVYVLCRSYFHLKLVERSNNKLFVQIPVQAFDVTFIDKQQLAWSHVLQ